KVWDDNVGQKAAVSGHFYADLVIAYFWDTFGRDSYDDNGHSLMVNVHDSAYINNAYWNGQGINFGDGDGTNYLPFSGGLDVVAHEFAHGVNSYSADLIYRFQSGALSEHFSDAFGAMVDRDDWLMGDEIRLADPGFIRSLADPTLRGHPAHMDDYLTLDITQDNGGVHSNSGIPNHCFYWACELISKDIVEQIWYHCLTTYLTPNSGFYFWAGMVFQSARDLYGTTYDSQIEQALEFVGLTTVYTVPASVSISLAMGGADSYDIWVYNPGSGSVDVTAVAPSVSGVTVTEIPGNHPTIPAGGSAGFQVNADGSSMTQCDIGATRDTLRFDVVGSFTAQIKLPLTSLVSYVPAGLQATTVGTSCVDFTPTNTTEIWELSRDGVNVVWSGSLLTGLVDGNDTTVYRTTFGEEKFIPVDDIHLETGLLSFRLASEDGRILGDVEYTWSPSSADSCEFIIADYTLYNPCDTTLSILTGLMCDFDILGSGSNHGYYQATDNLVYMVDDGDARAVGFALLSGPARNLRILDNPTYVWSGNFTDEVAYLQMLQTTNQDGSPANDYSALLTFGDEQLGPTDTLRYRVAWLYSNSGAAALNGILDKARAWAPGCCAGIRGNANGDPDDKANISDVSYLLTWLFGIPTGPEPLCFDEADANASGKSNITDVSYLLAWLFGIPTGPEPKPCP
ncbi:MAG: M4 family metallopeptidase, partial [candidate division Zixibacteria bacterium]|nr:M4 family metallopeptidase [candidate division Zixibacteria bacterium]